LKCNTVNISIPINTSSICKVVDRLWYNKWSVVFSLNVIQLDKSCFGDIIKVRLCNRGGDVVTGTRKGRQRIALMFRV
jgi:hypothetical protein